jgi:hypothetical protein
MMMSCLFVSLGSCIGISPDRLRERVCDYLSQNPFLYDSTTVETLLAWQDKTLDDYVRRMRSPSSWGGAIEIKAVSNLAHRVIYVRMTPTGQTLTFSPETPPAPRGPPCHITWDGGHFEPGASDRPEVWSSHS